MEEMYQTLVYGKNNTATVFTDNLDQVSRRQIQDMMDSELFSGSQVRIMPDVHAGKGSVIGFTASIGDKVCVNVVGVDIGCGVTLDRISCKRGMDFSALDKAIRAGVPSGFSVHKSLHPSLKSGQSKLGSLYSDIRDDILVICKKIGFDHDRAINSIGSLGGGNHFIEQVFNNEVGHHLHIHSGSRGFGAKLAEWHQRKANELFDAGKYPKGTPKVLAWLDGDDAEGYRRDVVVAQKYASLSRKVMAHIIKEAMGWDLDDHVESVHNYLDYDAGYIRKGAISAQEGERLVIPISMADGVIVGTGKGNQGWNYSAPHGAGRLLARGEAKRQLSMEEYKSRMEGVWSSCVGTDTLDESPMAYKGRDYILERIRDTIDVGYVAKPVYNFKAGGE